MIPGARCRAMLAAAISIAAMSCSHRVVEVDRLPGPAVLLTVDHYNQDPELCGPYALAAVLRFYGDDADAAELAGRLYTPAVKGTLTMDMYLEAYRRGYVSTQGPGGPAGVRRRLDSGIPVIILLKYPALLGGVGHYVVVTGYSNDPAGLFLLWGDGRLSWMDQRSVDTMWERTGRWMLVVEARR